jgi:hypothetical protein
VFFIVWLKRRNEGEGNGVGDFHLGPKYFNPPESGENERESMMGNEIINFPLCTRASKANFFLHLCHRLQ